MTGTKTRLPYRRVDSARVVIGAIALGLTVCLVGGAILWSHTAQVAKKNTGIICALGTALNDTKVEQRGEENLREFRKRVRITREFVASLNELDGCAAQPPAVVHLKKRDQENLKNDRKDRGGGANQTPSNPAPQQPSPPPSGGGDNGGSVGGTVNPPNQPNSPNDPVDQIVDDVCDLVGPLAPLPAVCR